MLSRTAASLYWIGRYVERAEFTSRLIEATLRLDALSARPAGQAAWESALLVTAANAKSVRTALTRDAWEAINRAWLGLRGLATTGGYEETLRLIELIRAETR